MNFVSWNGNKNNDEDEGDKYEGEDDNKNYMRCFIKSQYTVLHFPRRVGGIDEAIEKAKEMAAEAAEAA